MADPADEIFLTLLDSEEAREKIAIETAETGRRVRVILDHGEVDIKTTMSPRFASEFIDDMEMQADQMNVLDELEGVLDQLRDATYEAGTR